MGTASSATVGWGEVLWATGSGAVIFAYSVFTQRVPGRGAQEETAEAIPLIDGRYLVPFDDTGGAVTAIAIANASNSVVSQSVSVGVRTADGGVTQLPPITVPTLGHMSFAFPAQFPSTANQRGLAEFATDSLGIAIIALQFDAGAFTTVPVYAVSGPPIIITPN